MGGHTNYEVEFADYVDWDDEDVARVLPGTVTHLYLRDLDLPRVMLCIYSQSSISDILALLKCLYSTGMRYRQCDSNDEWITFS